MLSSKHPESGPAAQSLEQFLQLVVPWDSGYVSIHWKHPGKKRFHGQSCQTVDDVLRLVAQIKAGVPADVWFCTSSQKLNSGHRDRKHAIGLVCIPIDADVDPDDPKKYPTLAEAIASLFWCCDQLGIPRPSFLVASGGGLHAYWLSDRVLTVDEWQPYADALKAAFKTAGLKFDAAVTGDAARVLRVPGTTNWKQDGNPRPVRLLPKYCNGMRHDFAAVFGKIRSGKPSRPHNKKPARGLQDIKVAEAFKVLPVEPLIEPEIIKDISPLPLEPILKECGWLREAQETGGKTFDEPQWNLTTFAATFLENGHELAHQFGNRHPDYTPEETEEKWDEKIRARQEKDLGWPSCKAIQGAGATHCETCPHLASEGSPLHLGLHDPAAGPEPEPRVVPRDLWAKFDAPPLPTGLLPDVIEKFAFAQAELMGCDPAGIAMGALTVCATAIPDEIKLQVKQHDPRWRESTRLWTGLVGPPSTMKSPIMLRVIEPLKRTDKRALARYMEAMAAYEKLPAEERKEAEKPKLARIMLGDTTPEAAQLVLQDNPNGVLLFRDELSGWFGSMDKYSGHRGAASDRGFWLQSFNGGQYYVDRVTRRSGSIPNLSVSILGGIQVEPLRALVAEGVDDGLIQRIFPIMLRPAVLGKDEPLPADQYDDLVERLNEMTCRIVEFDAAAQQIRRKLEQKHLDLMAYESVNRKLAAHVGKYNGLFARLCLLWHCVETIDATGMAFNSYIDADTAQRVADFLHGFLLPHAISFYVGVVGLADDHDRLANVAGYILAHKLERITPRDIARGDRSMRKLNRQDTDSILHQLDALGWVSKVQGRRFHDVQWVVNPEVHRLFEERAKAEADRRQREREAIAIGYEVTQRRSS